MTLIDIIGKIAIPTPEAKEFFENEVKDIKLPCGEVVAAKKEFNQILIKFGPDDHWWTSEYFTFQ